MAQRLTETMLRTLRIMANGVRVLGLRGGAEKGEAVTIDEDALLLAKNAHEATAALVKHLEDRWAPSRFRGSLLDFAGASESLLEDVVVRIKETEAP